MLDVMGPLLERSPKDALSLLCSLLLARQPGGAAMVSEEELLMAVRHRVVWERGRLRLVPLVVDDSVDDSAT